MNAKIAMGSTGGNTIPFEPKGYEELREQAQALYEKLPRCAECGDVLGEKTYRNEWDDEQFCREYCAEVNYNRNIEEVEEVTP